MTDIDPAFAVASLFDRHNDFLRSIRWLVIGDLHTVSYMETPENHKKAVKRSAIAMLPALCNAAERGKHGHLSDLTNADIPKNWRS